jgi:sec-independent protein translocase protein TatA
MHRAVFAEVVMEGLFQPMHLLVILVIVLLIFGPKKLGDLGKGLGEGIRNFKSSMNEGNAAKTNDTTKTTTATPAPANPAPATTTTTEEKK